MNSEASADAVATPCAPASVSARAAVAALAGDEAEHIARRLEQRFATIQRERMQDMPMLNLALQVRAVGFQAWQGHCLGILITPWFMNLVLMPVPIPVQASSPQQADAVRAEPPQPTARVGDSRRQAFPSGSYLFTIAMDEELGSYQTCSLFSPMAEFGDQKTAVEVAEAIIDALMDDGNQDDSGSAHSEEVQRRWHGEPDDALEADSETEHGSADEEDLENTQAATDSEVVVSSVQDKQPSSPPAPISRRDLLRGAFRGSIIRHTTDSPPASDPSDA